MTFRTNCTPEGESKYKVFQNMTQQLRKLYLFFETVSEFPIGLLLMQFSMYYTVMDSTCALSIHMKKCGTKLMWDPFFGMLPPLYRDIWIRFSTCNIIHNACFTNSRLTYSY